MPTMLRQSTPFLFRPPRLRSYYVNGGTGNDSTGDGSLATPWATITKALATVSDVGVAILVAAGTYAENTGAVGYLNITRSYTLPVHLYAVGAVTITNASGTSYVMRHNAVSNIGWHGFAVVTAAQNSNGPVYIQNACANLVFDNCNIQTLATSGTRYCVQFENPVTHSITGIKFLNCTVGLKSGSSIGAYLMYGRVGASGTLDVLIDGGTWTGAGSNGVINIQQNSASMTALTATVKNATITGSTGDPLTLVGGTMTADGIAVTCASQHGVIFGVDGAGTYTTLGSIRNSNVASTKSTGHGLLIGGGTSAFLVDTVTMNGSAYALVVKECDGAIVQNSDLTGGNTCAAYFKGCTNPTITTSTLRNSAADVVLVGLSGAIQVQNVTLTHNSIIATGTAKLLNWPVAADIGGGICDTNAYDKSGSSGNVGTVQSTAGITTLAGLQAAWSGYTPSGNDSNSTLVP